MRRIKSKEIMKKALYEFLDWLETEQSEHIKLFWSSVFKDTIITHYPTLRLLRNSLMDGQSLFLMYTRVLTILISIPIVVLSFLV